MCLYKLPRLKPLGIRRRSWQCADLKQAHALRGRLVESCGAHLDLIYVSSFDGSPRVEVSTTYPARIVRYDGIAKRLFKEQANGIR